MRRESHVRFWESAGVRFPRATRLVRSIKEECLDRVIPMGEGALLAHLKGVGAHDNRERTHQGLGNRLFVGTPTADAAGRVHRYQRLGGLLNYYQRAA